MQGTMMQFPLTLALPSSGPESCSLKSRSSPAGPTIRLHRYTYGEMYQRARATGSGVQDYGLKPWRPRCHTDVESLQSILKPTSAFPSSAACCTRSTCACIPTNWPTSSTMLKTAC